MAEAVQQPKDSAQTEGMEGGSYEVIRRRLVEQGQRLGAKAEALNEKRKGQFGSTEMVSAGNERVRTEDNCIPVDMATVEGHLLFGYNVFVGLRKEIAIDAVFSLQHFRAVEGGFEFDPVPDTSFLHQPDFERDFQELYRYYKESRLVGLRVLDGKLLAVFQTGPSVNAIKVFRWALSKDGQATYIDNRGERDHIFPASHDFEWIRTNPDDHVRGRHPHVSIEDVVFVETVGGDLTVKIEDNTEDGQGIYREDVYDPHQSLDDGEIYYARVGTLVLLKILPNQETTWRYLIYDTLTQNVIRCDAIGQACVQLPEDHGVVFPGGYYLQTGDYKLFDTDDVQELLFKRKVVSPNGEDVLFIFHRKTDGVYLLFPYNLIRREVQQPIRAHGYTLFDDGKLLVFRATEEASRVHPVQIWTTPFMSAEFAAAAPSDGSLLGRIGNADLVRGISDCLTLRRLVSNQEPTRKLYEDLVRAATRTLDAYYWLGEQSIELRSLIEEIRRTAELVIDEFEKVLQLKRRARASIEEARTEQDRLLSGLLVSDFYKVEQFLEAMTDLRKQRGHLITLREVRYIDRDQLAAFEAQVVERFDLISTAVVDFLQREEALQPVIASVNELLAEIEAVEKTHQFEPMSKQLAGLSEGLSLLTEVVSGLQVDDIDARTTILESISEVFGQLNRTRAILTARTKELGAREARAEFGAQFKLLGQSVSSAIAMADTPEACDDNLSRLMLQLEELEGRFGEYDEFIPELITKREEVTEAFNARRQALLDARQQRIGHLMAAADRILQGANRRVRTFKEEDGLNAYFASDAMILKLRQIAEQLGGLGDVVKSDELLSRLKTARQDAIRQLRDRSELFEGGDNLIRLGRHRFSVNTRPVELTMVPRNDGMSIHLTNTDFYDQLTDPRILEARDYWQQSVISESRTVYRGEYLAASILLAAQRGEDGLSEAGLTTAALEEDGLLKMVRAYAAERYDEGYERGLHDMDATLILDKLLSIRSTAGLLRFPPLPRAVAALFWASLNDDKRRDRWHRRARSLGRLRQALQQSPAVTAFYKELGRAMTAWLEQSNIGATLAVDWSDPIAEQAGAYLAEELAADHPRFTVSAEAIALSEALQSWMTDEGHRFSFQEDLRALEGQPAERVGLAVAWMEAFAALNGDSPAFIEAAVHLLTDRALDWEVSHALTQVDVEGLLGQHPNIRDRVLKLRLDEFLSRLTHYAQVLVPAFQRWRQARHDILEEQRVSLRLEEFKPRVMSSFVRNRLINDVYLHLVGDNLAKQMGAAGDAKRTDLMGLLLLISPPGYGKTTLMEYVANRLGLVFMKVNGPALGHEVHSLDPAEAPNATARQEVEKINLAFEMGNNVMLYLDDIQHTHTELLQKFISLCDGQRKIEGVWKGRTRTYDLRGKKFCVVMAGNPYTESGDKFQIPDMLSNRADTYNLGDILGGKEDLFSLSYIENSLTSNATLAPLSSRSQEDTYKLIRMAQGEAIPSSELSYDYSAVEVSEITTVFKHMFRVQETLLAVNRTYIDSASMDDSFRTEPRFQLQGSYRNMNKVTEKIVPVMNDAELERLIIDHYAGEAQTLTTGAEANLLKFGELRDTLDEDQLARWTAIRKEFARQKMMGGADDDPVARVTGTIASLAEHLDAIQQGIHSGLDRSEAASTQQIRSAAALEAIQGALAAERSSTVLEGIQAALVDDKPNADLRQLTAELTAIRETIGAAAGQDDPEMGGRVDKIAAWLGHIHRALSSSEADTQIARVANRVFGLQRSMDATTAGLQQLRVLDWLAPRLDQIETPADVARVRQAVLAEAASTLRGDEHTLNIDPQDTALAAALPIIHSLVQTMADTVRSRLPAEEQDAFMDSLRRHVAGAVSSLADEPEARDKDDSEAPEPDAPA
jgi:hypothetical protein